MCLRVGSGREVGRLCEGMGLCDSCFDAGVDCGVPPDQRFGGRRGCAHPGYVPLASVPQPRLQKDSLALGALLQTFASLLLQISRYWRANSFE